MSKPKKDKFYLVQEDILPEAIKKTIKVGICMHPQVNKNGIGKKMNQSQRKFG